MFMRGLFRAGARPAARRVVGGFSARPMFPMGARVTFTGPPPTRGAFAMHSLFAAANRFLYGEGSYVQEEVLTGPDRVPILDPAWTGEAAPIERSQRYDQMAYNATLKPWFEANKDWVIVNAVRTVVSKFYNPNQTLTTMAGDLVGGAVVALIKGGGGMAALAQYANDKVTTAEALLDAIVKNPAVAAIGFAAANPVETNTILLTAVDLTLGAALDKVLQAYGSQLAAVEYEDPPGR